MGRTVSVDLLGRDLLTRALESSADATQQLHRALNDLPRRIGVQVDADTQRARREIDELRAEVDRLKGEKAEVKVDADTGGAIAGIGALRGALMGLAAISLVPVVAGVASIGAAAAVAGIGVGGLAAVALPAFGAIKKAIDAQTQAQQQSGAAASQSQSRALALAGAQQQVASAVRQASYAHAQALEQVRQAEERLTQAHQSEASAARELAQARQDARRQLEDVANNAADARLAERAAILDVADAQANYNRVLADPHATDLDRQRAKLQVDQARQIVKERHEATVRAIADEAAAKKAGVEGSDAVRSARDRLRQADQALTDAERALAQARANVARSDAQSADQVASARRGLASASLAGAAGNAALASSMAALTGPERTLMGQVLGLKGAFDSWRKSLEPTVLPVFGKGLEIIKAALPALTPFVKAAAGAVGAFLDRISAAVNSPAFAAFSKQLAGLVGPTLASALNGIANIAGSLAPLLLALAQAGAKIMGPFLGAINQIAGALASALAPVLKAMTPVFNQLVGALGPLIAQLVSGLSPILAGLAPILSELFGVLRPVISQLISGLQPVIASLVPVVGLLVGALGKILLSLTPILPPLGKLISSLITGLMPVLTPIVNLIAQTAVQIGGALVQALVQSMPAIQQMVLAFAKLLPELTPMVPLFGELLMAILPIVPPIMNLAAKLITLLVPVLRIAIQASMKWQTTLVKFVIPVIKKVAEVIAWLATKAAEWIPKIGAWFRRMYEQYIKPAMDKVGQAVNNVWINWIRPVFDKIRGAVGKVRDAFGIAVDAIKRIWDRLKGISRTPVNFVIGLYNDGIRPLVNGIAGLVGLPKSVRLGTIPTFAAGGTLASPVKAGPMKTRGPMAIVGEGRQAFPEFVIPTDPRFRGRAQALWAQAGNALLGGSKWMRGRDHLGGEGMTFARGGTLQALAGGGIIGGFLKGLKAFSFLDPLKAAKGALGRLLGGNVPGGGLFRDVIAKVPGWIGHELLGWLKSKLSGGGSGVGGPGMRNALNWAKAQAGKPYVWGGVGPGGFDCSGFMSAITNVIQGRSPYARRFTTFSFTGAPAGPAGFMRNMRSGFEVGVTNAGVGHMAGTLLGVPVESSGSRGVHYGPGARGAHDPLFGLHYGLKADTGALMLRPGWNPPVMNGTGRMEYLETPRRGGGDTHIHLHNHGAIGSKIELQNWMADSLEQLRRQGRLPSGATG